MLKEPDLVGTSKVSQLFTPSIMTHLYAPVLEDLTVSIKGKITTMETILSGPVMVLTTRLSPLS